MTTPPAKPGFLSRPIPLWAAIVAVLIAMLSSGTFAFGVAFGLFQQGVIAVPARPQAK
jgi:hypothetical protein